MTNSKTKKVTKKTKDVDLFSGPGGLNALLRKDGSLATFDPTALKKEVDKLAIFDPKDEKSEIDGFDEFISKFVPVLCEVRPCPALRRLGNLTQKGEKCFLKISAQPPSIGCASWTDNLRAKGYIEGFLKRQEDELIASIKEPLTKETITPIERNAFFLLWLVCDKGAQPVTFETEWKVIELLKDNARLLGFSVKERRFEDYKAKYTVRTIIPAVDCQVTTSYYRATQNDNSVTNRLMFKMPQADEQIIDVYHKGKFVEIRATKLEGPQMFEIDQLVLWAINEISKVKQRMTEDGNTEIVFTVADVCALINSKKSKKTKTSTTSDWYQAVKSSVDRLCASLYNIDARNLFEDETLEDGMIIHRGLENFSKLLDANYVGVKKRTGKGYHDGYLIRGNRVSFLAEIADQIGWPGAVTCWADDMPACITNDEWFKVYGYIVQRASAKSPKSGGQNFIDVDEMFKYCGIPVPSSDNGPIPVADRRDYSRNKKKLQKLFDELRQLGHRWEIDPQDGKKNKFRVKLNSDIPPVLDAAISKETPKSKLQKREAEIKETKRKKQVTIERKTKGKK